MINATLLNGMWINIENELENSNLIYKDLGIRFGTLFFTLKYLSLSKDIIQAIDKVLPYYEINHNSGEWIVRTDFRNLKGDD